jgi:hypothetical protein
MFMCGITTDTVSRVYQTHMTNQNPFTIKPMNQWIEDADYFDLDDGFYLDDEPNEPGTCGSPRVSKGAEVDELDDEKSRQGMREMRRDTDNYLRSIGHQIPREEDDTDDDDTSDQLTELTGSAGGPPALNAQRSNFQPGQLGQLGELGELGKLGKLPYKTLDDQIEVGDIVQDRNGQLMKRTFWGWDLCANSLK